MSDPYTQRGGGTSNDPYTRKGGSSRGSSDPYVTGGGTVPKRHGHGGIFGAIGHAAHVVAQKAGLAAHDVKAMPGGLVKLTVDEAKALNQTAHHPWVKNRHDPNYVGNTKAGKAVAADVHGMVHGAVESVKHPGRDPFATALTVLPLLTGGASAVARVGEAGAAARAGEGAAAAGKALVSRPPVRPRLVRVGEHQVPLQPSATPLVRAGQAVYDKALARAQARNPEGKLATHASKRVGGSIDETVRYQHRMRQVPAELLQHAARRLAPTGGRVPGTTANRFQRVQQAALELTSVNTTPELATAYHLEQASKGVNPALNAAVAKLYQTVHQHGMLTTNKSGDVIVNQARFPKLAEADIRLAQVQGRGDEILARYGVRTPEQLQTAADTPGRYRAGAQYEEPTPAKQGVPSAGLVRQRATVERLSQLHERAVAKAQKGEFTPDQQKLLKAAEKLPAVVESGTRTRPRTVAEAQAHLDKLDAQYEEFLSNFYEKKLTPGEQQAQREINQSRGKYRKQQAGGNKSYHGTHKVQRLEKNVAEQKRLEAETAVHKIAEAHPEMPAAQKFLRLSTMRNDLRDAIGQHQEAGLGGEQSTAPLGTVKSTGRVTREKSVHPLQRPLPSGKVVMNGRILAPVGAARAERLGGALSVARDKLEQMEQAAAKRVKPTGVVGGETARPGRGHVSYRSAEPKAARGEASGASSPVVGVARAPITSQANKGVNIALGRVPNDVTGQAARHYHQIVKFLNTSEHRAHAIKTGSPTRQTSRDVLVRVPGEETGKIPSAVQAILGKARLTNDDVEGINAALRAYTEDLIPGLRDNFAVDKTKEIGTEAPAGTVWVDRHVLGHLGKPAAGPRGKVARGADTINSAVTAATVYFKIGHTGTRALTNASANFIQGSLAPVELGRSTKLWKVLSLEDRRRALAAAGQHGYEAMPHEGVNRIGQIAGSGARWWAKHIDAPFRFNSIAYEARRAGYDTPAKFRLLLHQLENQENLDTATRAKVDFVAKRANRAQIAYDRLSDAERRFVTRGVWFYPWVKGSSMFAGHVLSEHPYKAAVLGAAGTAGRRRQERLLGELPSYEGGLVPLGTGPRPTVTDLSTFSPFVTPADVLEAGVEPKKLGGFLNPVAGAGVNLIQGVDQNGQPTNKPVAAALETLLSPTPEAQFVTAYLRRHQNQQNRMFEHTPRSALERALVGPAMPRRINVAAAHKAAGREKSGR